MTRRLRAGLLVAGSGLLLLTAACAEQTAAPTRAPISAAAVIATAQTKSGVKPPAGKPSGGEGAQLFSSQGCIGCHQIQGQGGAVGPNLSTIGSQAATRKPGTAAKDYIHESIVNPNAVIAPGFQPNVMPGTYGQTLKPEQIDALVNYLLEQK